MSEPKPVRLQRRRTKGFKLVSPNGLENVYVGRPTAWGNLWKVGAHSNHYGRAIATRAEAVERHATMLNERPDLRAIIREQLRGKNLVCFCPLDEPCHADTLLRMANEE